MFADDSVHLSKCRRLLLLIGFSIICSSSQADYVSGLDPDDFLALRKGPSTGFELILKMGPGTRLTVLESDGIWRKVKLVDGTVGWASVHYISPGSPPKELSKEALVSGISQTNTIITQNALEEAVLPTAQLWTHIRKNSDPVIVQKFLDEMRDGLPVAGVMRAISVEPIQVIDFGPADGQVRFFKPEDEGTAAEIATLAQSLGISVRPISFVKRYAAETWIEKGHIEIWLP